MRLLFTITKVGFLFLLALLLLLPYHVRADKIIAISYFDNTSGDIAYNALSKGIADMLITDLSKVPNLKIVEREKLEKLLQEIELGSSNYFDQKTAQRLGKGLGAEAILTGAFLVLDDQLRIDARLVDVATGNILTAEAVSGSKDDFFALHAKLVQLLVTELKIDYKASAGAKAKNVSLEAIVQYSTAIDYYDKGLSSDASAMLASTVKNNPNFTFAQNRLESIKQWLVKVEAERELLIKKETELLLSNLDASNPQIGQQINTIWTNMMTAQSYTKIIAINKELEKKNLKDDFRLYGEGSPITFGEMRYYYDAFSFYMLKDYNNTLTAGEAFIKRFPTSMYYAGVKSNMDQAIAELEDRENGKARIDASLQMAEFETYIDKFDWMNSRWKLEYMDPETYKKYKAVFVKRILNFGDKALIAYINGDGAEADDLFEFEDIALHFLDKELLTKISEKAIAVYGETTMEDKGYRIEESVDRSLEKIQKTHTKVREAQTKLKSATPEVLLKLVKDFRNLSAGLDWKLMLDISEQFIALPYDEKNAYYLRAAWEMRVVANAQLRNLKEAKKQLEAYKVVKELNEPDPKKHTKTYRALRTTLSEAKKSIATVEADELVPAIYLARAETYRDHHQFVDEAYTRRAMIDKLPLDEQQGSMQLYMLMMAYSNMGYFDKARSTAKELQLKYPTSSYTQSVEAVVKYMPN